MPSSNQWKLLHAPPAASIATIRMQLVFSKQIAIGIDTEELRSISKWVDHTLESMYESHHGVKASVLEPTVIEFGNNCPNSTNYFQPCVCVCVCVGVWVGGCACVLECAALQQHAPRPAIGDMSHASPSTEAGLDQALATWLKLRNKHDTELYTIFLLSTDDTWGIESSDRLVMGTSR